LKTEILKRVSPWLEKKLVKVWEAKKPLKSGRTSIEQRQRGAMGPSSPGPGLPAGLYRRRQNGRIAFKALNGRGLPSRWFDRHSSAQYFVRSVNEVGKFLSFLSAPRQKN